MGCNCGGSTQREPRVRRRTAADLAPAAPAGGKDVPARLRRGGGLFWTGNKRADPNA